MGLKGRGPAQQAQGPGFKSQLCKQTEPCSVFTFCLFGDPGVDVLSGLLCITLKVQLFHLCFVELAAEIFKRLRQNNMITQPQK